jgi:magnesium transporter
VTRIHKHENGTTSSVEEVDPAWLQPGSGIYVWVDLDSPSPPEARVLADVFHFHELAIEDAMSESHHPKVETYGEYLYLILHGIDFAAAEHTFVTKDVDFFLGAQYLVTVHPGVSRTLGRINDMCDRDDRLLKEGPGVLMYRIIDMMIDNYRPEVEKLEAELDDLEDEVFKRPDPSLGIRILNFKKDVSSLRRVVLPERDAVGRLARREFPLINEALAYRFRDVHDNLVRLADEAMFFQDRITSILDAHLSAVSNELSSKMKILTIFSTLFMPLTVLTGMWGMNVPLPHLPGGEDVQYWWVVGIMCTLSGGLLLYFRRKRWI